jgi:nitrate reductase / nitrite oxidoreductase, beta subunit
MDDYYEPFTFKYGDLTSAPAGDDQPTARPVSMVSGKPMKIEAGPNWDDDLSGSNVYAANDPGWSNSAPKSRRRCSPSRRW